MEDKNCGVVVVYGSGYVRPRCVGLYGARCDGEDSRHGNGTWNDAIYGNFLVGSFGNGCPFHDLEGLSKSLDKFYLRHSLYDSQYLSPDGAFGTPIYPPITDRLFNNCGYGLYRLVRMEVA